MEPDRQAARSVLAAFQAAAAHRSELEEPRVVQQLGAAVVRTLVAQAPVARQALRNEHRSDRIRHSSNDWIVGRGRPRQRRGILVSWRLFGYEPSALASSTSYRTACS